EKKTQSAMYWLADGLSSEMFLRAIGMNAPGLARAAPAPMIATAGDEATFCIWSIMLAMRFGFGGLRSLPTTQAIRSTPATTSKTATAVFGVLGVWSAAE